VRENQLAIRILAFLFGVRRKEGFVALNFQNKSSFETFRTIRPKRCPHVATNFLVSEKKWHKSFRKNHDDLVLRTTHEERRYHSEN